MNLRERYLLAADIDDQKSGRTVFGEIRDRLRDSAAANRIGLGREFRQRAANDALAFGIADEGHEARSRRRYRAALGRQSHGKTSHFYIPPLVLNMPVRALAPESLPVRIVPKPEKRPSTESDEPVPHRRHSRESENPALGPCLGNG